MNGTQIHNLLLDGVSLRKHKHYLVWQWKKFTLEDGLSPFPGVEVKKSSFGHSIKNKSGFILAVVVKDSVQLLQPDVEIKPDRITLIQLTDIRQKPHYTMFVRVHIGEVNFMMAECNAREAFGALLQTCVACAGGLCVTLTGDPNDLDQILTGGILSPASIRFMIRNGMHRHPPMYWLAVKWMVQNLGLPDVQRIIRETPDFVTLVGKLPPPEETLPLSVGKGWKV